MEQEIFRIIAWSAEGADGFFRRLGVLAEADLAASEVVEVLVEVDSAAAADPLVVVEQAEAGEDCVDGMLSLLIKTDLRLAN